MKSTITLILTLYFTAASADDSPLKIKDTELQATAKDQSWFINPAQHQKLLNAQVGDVITLSGFPEMVSLGHAPQSPKDIKLSRYELMAPGAEITVINGKKSYKLKPEPVLAFSGAPHGLGILLNPKTGDVSGTLVEHGISMNITGNLQTGLDFRANASEKSTHGGEHACHTNMQEQPTNLQADLALADMSKTLYLPQGGSPIYEAVLAIETDTEWMAGNGNSTTTAMNDINTLFVNMNVYFERDVSLRWLMGNVFLRVGSDPYPTEPDISQYLTDFGEYWRVNQGHIDRDFAAMLSGQSIGNFSFSGIAWINQYCNNGQLQGGGSETFGSYSVNRIGSSASLGFIAQFLAHELGHNLGSPHTHCYNPFVDECYNAEGGSCFAGTPSCPAGGKGTIMSYCHFGAPNGADCGLSDDEFHPTVISRFNTRIQSNYPSCIQDLGSDVIFEDGFE